MAARFVAHWGMALKEPSFTIGIEEEYHLVDVGTRDLVAAPPGLISDCEKALGDQVRPEFLRSQIEVGTRVCRSLAEARAELARLRGTVAQLASAHGLAPIAAGTHPFGRPEAIEPTDKERYKLLVALVVPRPIALVTSLSAAGVVNAAPFSFFNVLGDDPPIVILSVDQRTPGSFKDTAGNIQTAR